MVRKQAGCLSDARGIGSEAIMEKMITKSISLWSLK
jgi:hypothetical protein